MSKPIICVGDALDHGGSVVSGTPFTDLDGRAMARVGDHAVCGRHGPTSIVSGDSTLIVDGQAVARHGDKAACGAMLISSQAHAFVDEDTKSGTSGRGVHTSMLPEAAGASASTRFSRTFMICNSASGRPLPWTPYRVTLADGRVIEGTTDEEGLTREVTAAMALNAIIEVFA
ncbi:hypothetical protein CO641_11785 [Lysobacteraceae bacterium NML91-0213]|nr:hypothetical protein CO641_11785 [Xanthomonadaceae bacterium NML91-0213]